MKNRYYSYIKRVIALPGEHVQIKDGSVYVKEQKLEEDSTAYRNAKLILLFAIGFNPHCVVEKDFLSICTETLNKMSKERDNVA